MCRGCCFSEQQHRAFTPVLHQFKSILTLSFFKSTGYVHQNSLKSQQSKTKAVSWLELHSGNYGNREIADVLAWFMVYVSFCQHKSSQVRFVF